MRGSAGIARGWFSLAVLVFVSATPRATMAQASDLRRGIVEHHQLHLPDGPGPYPTVIGFSGCGGLALPDSAREAALTLSTPGRIVRGQYAKSAERLRGHGYAVILVDVHQSEGLLIACRGEIPNARVADYVDTAIDWAITLSFVDPDRLHLLGWSMGASGVLTWVHRSDEARSGQVRSAITYYPQCVGRDSLKVHTPLLMLLGGADETTPAPACQGLVVESAQRARVTVNVYPGALHSFDVEAAPPYMEMAPGRPVGYHAEVSEAAWSELLRFLEAGR